VSKLKNSFRSSIARQAREALAERPSTVPEKSD